MYFENIATRSNNEMGCQKSQNKCKLRYLGGMCVAKVVYRENNYIMRNIYKEKADIQSKQQMVRYLKKHTYNSLDIAQSLIFLPRNVKRDTVQAI